MPSNPGVPLTLKAPLPPDPRVYCRTFAMNSAPKAVMAYLYKHTMAKTTAVILIVVNSFRQDERQDRLWVFFDEKGTLTHYGSTLEAKNARQAWPFNRIYKKERYEGSRPEEPTPEETPAEESDKKEAPAQ